MVASTGGASGRRRLELKEKLKIDRNTWLAARCGGPSYEDSIPHRDVWNRGIFARAPLGGLGGGELVDREFVFHDGEVIDVEGHYSASACPVWISSSACACVTGPTFLPVLTMRT